MPRRFYGFNDLETVKGHISKVVTLSDCLQLGFDITAANCNLTRFIPGKSGVYAVDCMATTPTYRHLFFTPSVFVAYGGKNMPELQVQNTGYTVLKD